jgi:hypothetical protein
MYCYMNLYPLTDFVGQGQVTRKEMYSLGGGGSGQSMQLLGDVMFGSESSGETCFMICRHQCVKLDRLSLH